MGPVNRIWMQALGTSSNYDGGAYRVACLDLSEKQQKGKIGCFPVRPIYKDILDRSGSRRQE